MTEFGLTLGIALLAVVISMAFARSALRAEQPSRALRETTDTLRVATSSVVRLQSRAQLVLLLLVAFVLFVAFGFARPHHPTDPASSAVETATWVAGSFLLGAFLVLAILQLSARGVFKSAQPLACSSRAIVAPPVQTAVRVSSLWSLLALALPLVGFITLAAAAWFRFGGLGSAAPVADPGRLPQLLLGFGLGAALSALSTRLLAGVFGAATHVSAALATDPIGTLPPAHLKNPAWLARAVALVLQHAGGACVDVAASVAALFASSIVLGATHFRANPSQLGTSLGVIFFVPLLVAFGLFASLVGVLVVRADPRESSVRAFDRGLATTGALTLAGHLACARWVFDAHWLPVACVCATGLAAALLGIVVSRSNARLAGAARARLQGATEGGVGPLILAGTARGAERSAWMTAAVLCPLGIAYFVGSRSGLQGGGAYSVAIASAAMLAPSAYAIAAQGTATVSTTAALLLAAQPTAAEQAERSEQLQEVAWAGGLAVGGLLPASTAGVVLSVLLALTDLSGPPKATASAGTIEFAVGSLLAVLAVVWFGARALSAVWRTAESTLRDIRRHVRSGLTQEGATLTFSENYDPEHQSCLGMLMQDSVRQAIPVGLLVLGLALVVEVVLQWLTARSGAQYATECLVVALLTACASGMVLAYLLEGSAAAWSANRRLLETKLKSAVDDAQKRANTSWHGAAIVSDTVGGQLETMAAPSLQALLKVLVTVTVVLAPLFL